jgi:riboflavin biosynthesis pyrimidine reductase
MAMPRGGTRIRRLRVTGGVRSLLPPLEEQVDPLTAVGAELRPAWPHRPWILTNMIASADGATSVSGRSGPLGGPADQSVFAALRSVSDAIVVGGQTVRAERYRAPGTGPGPVREARAARGQAPRPRLVVVTASLGLDPDLPLFDDPANRPIIATTASAPARRRDELAAVADIVEMGDDSVDLTSLLGELRRQGLRVVLSEGGPSLNAQLIAADLVDEWNLTVAPLLASGEAKRAAQGQPLDHPAAPMQLDRVWLADQLLFCRWVRSPAPC